jgi:hypothetical protein
VDSVTFWIPVWIHPNALTGKDKLYVADSPILSYYDFVSDTPTLSRTSEPGKAKKVSLEIG